METLERIRDICDRYEHCVDGCPLIEDPDVSNKFLTPCLLDLPPSKWKLDKIEEVLKEVRSS